MASNISSFDLKKDFVVKLIFNTISIKKIPNIVTPIYLSTVNKISNE
jgi:hypothetical protein